MNTERIRNFCIIAHVDHGKTTLSDRLLESTHTVDKRILKDQMLDSMDLERERGITIKSHPVSMKYVHKGQEYLLNLIDTPGHVDFSYEVSRSLAACEGALLLVDASQGIEAQTVANAYLALDQNLKIIPIINKVDLPGANVELIQDQIEEVLAIPREESILASAKTGLGVDAILEAVVERLPPPPNSGSAKVRALIFDSLYDTHRGVICYVRLFSGKLKAGDKILMMGKERATIIKEVGRFMPQMKSEPEIDSGSTGYVVTAIKELNEIAIGDTVTLEANPSDEMLPGYQKVCPMVFSGIYPLDNSDYGKLKSGIAKLQLNDAALVCQPESSAALGFGMRCGFLGLLHMEIVQERLRREYDLDIISTYPSVIYKVHLTNGQLETVDNPTFLKEVSEIEFIEEPTIVATLHIPNEFIGDALALVSEKRGHCERTETIDAARVMIVCVLPLNEILLDFSDRLKSMTRGYGSMDYDVGAYQKSNLVKLDIMVHGEFIDAFSSIVHRDKAESRGRFLCERLKDVLPKQMFKVPIQATVGGKIVARETLSAYRKDVTAKCYGGDISRKRKLLEKQKKGKKRMKQFGKIAIPQEAFVQILKPEN